MFKKLGLKGLRVRINTLGDKESRLNYREALVNYFSDKIDNLCSDCKNCVQEAIISTKELAKSESK